MGQKRQKKFKKFLNVILMRKPVQWEKFSGLPKKFFEQFDREFGIRRVYKVRMRNAHTWSRIVPILDGYLIELRESLKLPKAVYHEIDGKIVFIEVVEPNWSFVSLYSVVMDEEEGTIFFLFWEKNMHFNRLSNLFE